MNDKTKKNKQKKAVKSPPKKKAEAMKHTKPPSKTKRLSNEVKGILVIAIAAFTALCVFTGGQSGIVGSIGGFFKNILMGLFGAAAYVFFLIILLVGINLFIDKKEKTNSYNPWLTAAVFLCTSVLTALIYDDTVFGSSGFFNEIVSMYEFGIEGYGGGVFGGLLCRLTCMLIGKVGAWILDICIMLILVIMLTGASFEKFIKRIAFSVKNNAKSLRENMETEVDADIDEEKLEEQMRIKRERQQQKRLKQQQKRQNRTAEKHRHSHSRHDGEHYGPVRSSDYFELYFSGKDINELDSLASGKSSAPDFENPNNSDKLDLFSDDDLIRCETEKSVDEVEITTFEIPKDDTKSDLEQVANALIAIEDPDNSEIEVETVTVPRFSFSDLETDLFSDDGDLSSREINSSVDLAEATLDDTLKSLNDSNIVQIELENQNSNHNGILTDIPTDISEFTNEPLNEEGTDFEPPSLVQLEERLDEPIKKAREAGVPMDRVFTSVKNNTVKEAAETANKIENEIKQNAEDVKKIDYQLPTVDILSPVKSTAKNASRIKAELEEKANKLLETLASFKVEAKIINITHGPTVTRFELQPGPGIKVSKITGLSDDIALSLAAAGVRIEAPIPGKSAVGIEIPNEKPSPVQIREVIDTDKFRSFDSKIAFALGKDIGGNCVITDIAQFPHVLIAGATGSGKSVCINSLITSILYKAKPDEVKMIMIDPKMVELGVYNGIPHLLIPVVTDPKHASGALNWAVAEMKNRYNLLKDNKVRNIQGYNKLMEEQNEPDLKLPEIVIIIDELADLMMAAKNEVEDAINSLAALARAAGMYLVIATQRPSVDVITGVIKSNVPSRISFAVSSQIDSRTILDSGGAEKLLGKGDMLYAPRGASKPLRVQGNFVSDEEIENLIAFIKSQYEAVYDEEIIEHIEREREIIDSKTDLQSDERPNNSNRDEVYIKSVELALENGQASVAMLQRKLKIGYQKAARIIDKMEDDKIIGPYEGTKPRRVLITRTEFNEMLMNNLD